MNRARHEALYENPDRRPVTVEDIRKAYDIVNPLLLGLQDIVQMMIESAADDQYGPFHVINQCLECIDEELFCINPKRNKETAS